MSITSASIIGSGNLASHLAKVLFRNNIRIVNICSVTFDHANHLASLVDSTAVRKVDDLGHADLLIICVSDSAINAVSNAVKLKSLIVHTSGSTPANVLSAHENYGVLYPFQTFSKNVEIDFSGVPIFIEANNANNIARLKRFAEKISDNVKQLDSEQRLKLHLSAVFASNFSNHMFSIAKDMLKEANLPFELLEHLIYETTIKAIKSGDPCKVQTGPAVRGNLNILERHKEILAVKPLWQKIYTFVSNSIMDRETELKHGTF